VFWVASPPRRGGASGAAAAAAAVDEFARVMDQDQAVDGRRRWGADDVMWPEELGRRRASRLATAARFGPAAAWEVRPAVTSSLKSPIQL
jgi:cell division inhibitor SulA